ncbi:MAG: hypothetical protein AAGF32_09540 [Pseudomonadota bacterium]
MLTTERAFERQNFAAMFSVPLYDRRDAPLEPRQAPLWSVNRTASGNADPRDQFRNWYRTNDAVAHCMANDLF